MAAAPDRPRIDLVSRAGITGFPPGFVARCPRCRYDLTGLKDGKCPECGTRFTIAALIAQWKVRRARQATDTEFLLGTLLVLPAVIPVDVRDPVSLLWKAPVLLLLWIAVGTWVSRRAAEFRDPDQAHRLLWLWVPCAATAMGLSRTPILGEVAAALSLVVAGGAAITAWRRAPERTSLVGGLALGTPAALVAVVGLVMLLSASAGRAGGQHWSFADYPSWYWRGVPGRFRGVNNRDAVGLGGILLAGGSVMLALVAAMWLLLGRRWRGKGVRRRVAYG